MIDKFLKSTAIHFLCALLWFYLAWGNFAESGINALVIVQIICGIYMLVRGKIAFDRNKKQ